MPKSHVLLMHASPIRWMKRFFHYSRILKSIVYTIGSPIVSRRRTWISKKAPRQAPKISSIQSFKASVHSTKRLRSRTITGTGVFTLSTAINSPSVGSVHASRGGKIKKARHAFPVARLGDENHVFAIFSNCLDGSQLPRLWFISMQGLQAALHIGFRAGP